MEFNDLKTASDDLAEGEWVTDLPNIGDARLKVRSMSAPAVVRALGRAMRAASDDDGNVSPDVVDQIDLKVIAEQVLLDWDGFTQDGEPVKHSPGLARVWLETDLFMTAVRVAAHRVQEKSNKRLAALAKNSQSPSSKKPRAA